MINANRASGYQKIQCNIVCNNTSAAMENEIYMMHIVGYISLIIKNNKPIIFRAIKIIHVFCACLWGGSSASMTLIQCLYQAGNATEQIVSSLLAMYIECYLVVPSAFGCLLTGIGYAVFTKFGFFRFKWIVFKWAITILYLIMGFMWYMPWLEKLTSNRKSVDSLSMIALESSMEYFTRISLDIAQIIVVFSIVCMSLIKPWGHVKKSIRNARAGMCANTGEVCGPGADLPENVSP